MSFVHGRKPCPAVLHYFPLRNSANTPNNPCSCTAGPSFTLLPHPSQIPQMRDHLCNPLKYGWPGSTCTSYLCTDEAFKKYSDRTSLGILTIWIWNMGVGINMHFSRASSGQSVQAPEGFGWQFRCRVLAVWKRTAKSQTQRRTGYRVPAAAGEQLELDERIFLPAHRDGVPKGAAINISTIPVGVRLQLLYFCTLRGQHPHKIHWQKMAFWHRKQKEVRVRVWGFKTAFQIRTRPLPSGRRNPFYREKLSSRVSGRGLFSSSKHHSKAGSRFQQFCWAWVTPHSSRAAQDIKTTPHSIILNRKGKPHKTGANSDAASP